jgi:hypothetical protein
MDVLNATAVANGTALAGMSMEDVVTVLTDVELLSSVVCLVMLCFTCAPSPFAVPLATFFVFGIDNAMYKSVLDLVGGHWGMVAYGVGVAAIGTYWINGLFCLAIGTRGKHLT